VAARILAFAGALRHGSYNRKLLALGVDALRALPDVELDVLDLHEVAMPLYDGDLEDASGFPAGATKFRERLQAASGILVVSPEYNASIPGTLKNAIDWSSRPPGQVWRGKVVAMMSASPGMLGGNRMLPDLRKVLSAIGAIVLPTQLGLSGADKAFGPDGKLSESLMKQLDALIKQLAETTRKLAPGS
jgi:chromate reductase, NAD(P)H dehydrogenase (quinone)